MFGPRPGSDTDLMFVYYFVLLPETRFQDAERSLLDALDSLPGIGDVAYRQGEELRARIGVGDGRIAKTVRLQVGGPVRGARETTVPLTWEATGAPGLFPKMEADLVISAMGPDVTHLSVRGTYRPPLGPLGIALDRALLHRVAEASVKGFVDRLATALQTQAAATG